MTKHFNVVKTESGGIIALNTYVVTNFLGGPQTKMKKSSENFWLAKKGFPNFSPVHSGQVM